MKKIAIAILVVVTVFLGGRWLLSSNAYAAQNQEEPFIEISSGEKEESWAIGSYWKVLADRRTGVMYYWEYRKVGNSGGLTMVRLDGPDGSPRIYNSLG